MSLQRNLVLCFAILCSVATQAAPKVAVAHLLCENLVNPLGIDNLHPAFSWQMQSPVRNSVQAAYEIEVSSGTSFRSRVWSSGKVTSAQSLYIIYQGQALNSGQQYYWRVRVWDQNQQASAWSNTASFAMGILETAGWKADWITASPGRAIDSEASPLLRNRFQVSRPVKRAIVYITAHGLYEGFINGARIGDASLTPGWTSYHKRLQYQAYDLTAFLKQGGNSIAVRLGNGWYKGIIGWNDGKALYGDTLALLAQLQIEYTNGKTSTIGTGPSWKSNFGEIRYSEIYNGETIDAAQEIPHWKDNGCNDASWKSVSVITGDKKTLVATTNELVKQHEVLPALKLFETPAKEMVADFGQNLVGFVRVRLNGKPGDSIVIEHGEVLDKKGNFYNGNLRRARQKNVYILKGGAEEIMEPHFTFQGFRYIRISGSYRTIKPADLTAVALYSAMPQTGSFATSDTLLNQLQHNITWGQRGNFLDVPTDCPQRDERLGWTGDAQVFFRTAAFNRNVYAFFCKWMKDVAADQWPDGSVPFVIPNVFSSQGDAGSAGWSDVATIIPWNLYQLYGDRRALEEQYPAMKAWVGYMQKKSTNDLWKAGFHFGDWLYYSPTDDLDGLAAITDKYLIAQCFYAYSTSLLIKAAAVLDKTEDMVAYTLLLDRIKAAFRQEYMTPNGALVSNTQTAYVLTLAFDMLPEAMRGNAVNRLVSNINSYNNHLTTGFLGTPLLCPVLSRFGRNDLAYTLLTNKTYPSWLYPVTKGATTIWERWDGIRPDGSFQNEGMNSFNHYAYGAIGEWMYQQLAGIQLDSTATAYRSFIIKPFLPSDSFMPLNQVQASLESPYGKIAVRWQKQGSNIVLDAEIPANSSAMVYLPATAAQNIQEGGVAVEQVKEIEKAGTVPGYRLYKIGSGAYHFTIGQ